MLERRRPGRRAGEFVAIAGPNGGGKTTLLRLILGLERPSAGEALLFGEPAHRFSAARSSATSPQRAQLGGEAPGDGSRGRLRRTAPARGLLGPLRAGDRALVDEAIARVGLADRRGPPARTLSGGQQQRAFIAKALAAEPSLLVLDEPTTGVDAEAQEALAALLDRLHRELGVTILYVSHEFGAVERFVSASCSCAAGSSSTGPPSLPGVWHDPSHVHA